MFLNLSEEHLRNFKMKFVKECENLVNSKISKQCCLDLITICYCIGNMPLSLILFEESKPLTVYEFNHIVFELTLYHSVGPQICK